MIISLKKENIEIPPDPFTQDEKSDDKQVLPGSIVIEKGDVRFQFF